MTKKSNQKPSQAASKAETKQKTSIWNQQQRRKYKIGIQIYGGHIKMTAVYIGTKTLSQLRSFHQKMQQKKQNDLENFQIKKEKKDEEDCIEIEGEEHIQQKIGSITRSKTNYLHRKLAQNSLDVDQVQQIQQQSAEFLNQNQSSQRSKEKPLQYFQQVPHQEEMLYNNQKQRGKYAFGKLSSQQKDEKSGILAKSAFKPHKNASSFVQKYLNFKTSISSFGQVNEVKKVEEFFTKRELANEKQFLNNQQQEKMKKKQNIIIPNSTGININSQNEVLQQFNQRRQKKGK